MARAAEAVADTFSEAMLGRDFAALGASLAPEVELASPITSSFRFRGRDDVLGVLRGAREVIEDLSYSTRAGTGDVAVLNFRCRIGDQELEGLDLMRLPDDGAIREITVFIRPMAGLARLASALGPRLADSPWRASAIRALSAPLVLATRGGDRLGARLVGRRPTGD